MCKSIVWSIVLYILLPGYAASYDILGVCPIPVKSHWSACESVLRALSDAGHNVTIIGFLESNFSPRPNHKVLQFDGAATVTPKPISGILKPTRNIDLIFSVGLDIFDLIMKQQKMQKFLKEDHKFDLVIVESFGTEAFYGFGELFNAPQIGLSTTMSTGWLNYAVGNSDSWSFVPNQFLETNPEMSFRDRINNVILNIYEYVLFTQFQIPEESRLMKKYFPNNKKSLEEVLKSDICMGFVNNHYTLSLPRPSSPNLIEIGGIHLDLEAKKDLPEDFQRFLDSSEHGVIVFSLGSILKASALKQEHLQVFINVFAKLEPKVIWLYDLPDADQLPKNIMARSWIPQREILAHPNVKILISHGGMLSTTEAIQNGVPILGIPFYGDQHVNIARAKFREYAAKISCHNIKEENLNATIQELLTNPKYQTNAKFYSVAFQDRPMTPQATVVYWSEYIIRHNCAPFMKVLTHKMGIIELNNLDLWACFLLMIVCSGWLIYIFYIFIFKTVLRMKKQIKID